MVATEPRLVVNCGYHHVAMLALQARPTVCTPQGLMTVLPDATIPQATDPSTAPATVASPRPATSARAKYANEI